MISVTERANGVVCLAVVACLRNAELTIGKVSLHNCNIVQVPTILKVPEYVQKVSTRPFLILIKGLVDEASLQPAYSVSGMVKVGMFYVH